jgi:GNAT superfamily N-acetyltransferase
MSDIQVRPIIQSDHHWLKTLTRCHFGSEKVVVHGNLYYPADEAGFVALIGKKRVGTITLEQDEETCEVILLDALENRDDIFFALLQATEKYAREAGCKRLILTTTNDNTDALRIYQQYGFHLFELRPNAVAASRKMKPEIPGTGDHGIPIRDELELELKL